MKQIVAKTDQAQLIFEIQNNRVLLVKMNNNDLRDAPDNIKTHFGITELQITGRNFHHKGLSFVDTNPGSDLIYQKHQLSLTETGKQLVITQTDVSGKIVVDSVYQLFNDTQIIRSWTKVSNHTKYQQGIEYLSSFAITGINQSDDLLTNYSEHNQLFVANNNWTAEAQWKKASLKDLGLDYWVDGEKKQAATKRISINNNSSWSCSEYSPTGLLTNEVTKETAVWEIENNGAWHYEITDIGAGNLLALRLSGPEELDNGWWHQLDNGDSFTTCKVAFGEILGDPEDALQELTKYRRLIRRKNDDNRRLPVIFNDYMNGLAGDPTTKKEIPLINQAQVVGCEYYVIDCGWYAPGYWWDSVGEWMPSEKRFPDGIEQLIQYIRNAGMIPGLWLEIEVMGIHCPLADKLPDDWFFMRHGKRIIDADRYHLDFRNSEVVEFADAVVKRLVEDYGVGYIKMDYNITTGLGTDLKSDSVGDGLLEHNRAYIEWIKTLFKKYPKLVIENCGSGGMRHDYAMLAQHSIQSLTDQTDYVRNGNVAAVGASVVAPEQCAVWSYPLTDGDDEEVVFNMVNAMLLRIHQSGLLDHVQGSRLRLVKQGIETYKTYRQKIPQMLPAWPDGLTQLDDEWFSFALKGQRELYLAVWRGHGQRSHHQINLAKYGNIGAVKVLYPDAKSVDYKVYGNQLNINFPTEKMARLFHVSFK